MNSDQTNNPTKKLINRSLKFKKPSIINFIGTQKTSNKSEMAVLNRKRVIQMLDLFNSKYDCKKCRKKLRYKADQIIHAKLKHNHKQYNAQTLIKCPECHVQFKTYLSLTSHLMTVHLNERPYGCKICNKKFHAFALLKRHCHKKHLNLDASPSSLLSPVSLNSTPSPQFSNTTTYSCNSVEATSTCDKANNLYDLIDYENSILIPNSKSDCDTASVSSSSPNSITSFSSSTSCTNSYLLSSVNNPLSVNSNSNMKYFNYIKKIGNDHTMDLDPIIQYLDEEKQQEKELNAKLNQPLTFTILTQLNLVKCKLCSHKFGSHSEYLNHVWRSHLSTKALSNDDYQSTCWTCKVSNTRDTYNKVVFKNDTLLVSHLQEHLTEKVKFRCDICPSICFNSLAAVKAHQLRYHVKNGQNKENARFTYSCTICEQNYIDFGEILKHFEESSRCNPSNKHTKIKCILCQLDFSNESVFNMHLNQHKYLEKFCQKRVDQTITNNNIKNSNNNKQYSIDAIVNSPVKLTKKNKLEEIASKISEKQQQARSDFQNFQTALASLLNMSNNPELNLQKAGLFGQNFSQLATNYSQFFNDQDKTKLNQKKPTKSHNMSLNQPGSSYASLTNSAKMTNFASAFGIPSLRNETIINHAYSNNNNSTNTNPFFHQINAQQQHYLNSLAFVNPQLNFDRMKNASGRHIPFISTPNLFSNQSKTSANQNLTIQTAVPSSLKTSDNNHSDYTQPSSLLAFKCELCGYSYKNLTDLISHRSLHISVHKKKPLKCHLCSIKFSKAEQLMKHMIVHKANGTDSVCYECFATFSRKQDLDRHLIFHEDAKKLKT